MRNKAAMPQSGFSAADKSFMAEALALGRAQSGKTGDNPAVGAVLAQGKGSAARIVGRGATAAGGRPHAETEALAEAGAAARGATLYVTLEPCCHTGQTPPCADALAQAGIARAVVALRDPDPRVHGGGLAALRRAGVAVELGCMEVAAADDLAGYLCRRRFARPLISAKLAVSADGCIGLQGQGKVAITGAEAQRETHRLRAAHDAVMIGIGTALADNPRLDCRLLSGARLPVRIVADTELRLAELAPQNSFLLQTARAQPLWLLCGESAPAERQARLEAAGCRVIRCAAAGGRLDLRGAMGALAQAGIGSILLEGGAKLMQAFWDKGMADRLIILQSPLILGAKGYKKPDFGAKSGYEKVSARHLGADMMTVWLHFGGAGGLAAENGQ